MQVVEALVHSRAPVKQRRDLAKRILKCLHSQVGGDGNALRTALRAADTLLAVDDWQAVEQAARGLGVPFAEDDMPAPSDGDLKAARQGVVSHLKRFVLMTKGAASANVLDVDTHRFEYIVNRNEGFHEHQYGQLKMYLKNNHVAEAPPAAWVEGLLYKLQVFIHEHAASDPEAEPVGHGDALWLNGDLAGSNSNSYGAREEPVCAVLFVDAERDVNMSAGGAITGAEEPRLVVFGLVNNEYLAICAGRYDEYESVQLALAGKNLVTDVLRSEGVKRKHASPRSAATMTFCCDMYTHLEAAAACASDGAVTVKMGATCVSSLLSWLQTVSKSENRSSIVFRKDGALKMTFMFVPEDDDDDDDEDDGSGGGGGGGENSAPGSATLDMESKACTVSLGPAEVGKLLADEDFQGIKCKTYSLNTNPEVVLSIVPVILLGAHSVGAVAGQHPS